MDHCSQLFTFLLPVACSQAASSALGASRCSSFTYSYLRFFFLLFLRLPSLSRLYFLCFLCRDYSYSQSSFGASEGASSFTSSSTAGFSFLPYSLADRNLAIQASSFLLCFYWPNIFSVSSCSFLMLSAFSLSSRAFPSSTSIRLVKGSIGRGFRFSGPPHQLWQYFCTCSSSRALYSSAESAQVCNRNSLTSLTQSKGASGLTETQTSLLWLTSISVSLRWSTMLILALLKSKRLRHRLLKQSMYCFWRRVVWLVKKQWASQSLISCSLRQRRTIPLSSSLLRSTILPNLSVTQSFSRLKQWSTDRSSSELTSTQDMSSMQLGCRSFCSLLTSGSVFTETLSSSIAAHVIVQ